MKKRNARRGNTQIIFGANKWFSSPLEGEDVRRTKEGARNKSGCIPPHPASGHPLPQGARMTTHGFTARSVIAQCFNAGYTGRKGFTLIELLVVVLIIGILAAVALPQYQKAVLKSRFASMIPVVDALVQAERFYYQEHGTYTTNLSLLDVTPPTSSAFVIGTWFNSAQTQGVIVGEYKGKIQYLCNIMGNGTQECRAHKDNTLAIAVCSSYGEYVDTYGEWKAYRM